MYTGSLTNRLILDKLRLHSNRISYPSKREAVNGFDMDEVDLFNTGIIQESCMFEVHK
jgi:hypothetical protein